MQHPWSADKDASSPGPGLSGSCAQGRVCQKLNSGPLQGQSELLRAEKVLHLLPPFGEVIKVSNLV